METNERKQDSAVFIPSDAVLPFSLIGEKSMTKFLSCVIMKSEDIR